MYRSGYVTDKSHGHRKGLRVKLMLSTVYTMLHIPTTHHLLSVTRASFISPLDVILNIGASNMVITSVIAREEIASILPTHENW